MRRAVFFGGAFVLAAAACGLELGGSLASGTSNAVDASIDQLSASLPDGSTENDGGTDATTRCDAGGADFATSTQHCGSCGHDCLGGGCEAGTCLPFSMAGVQSEAQGLAIDSTNIYWTNTNLVGRVGTCALGGCGGTPTVLAQGQTSPNAVLPVGNIVYWTNYNASTLLRCGKTGCNQTPTVHTTVTPASIGFGRLASDGLLLFFTDGGNGKVHSCSLTNCAGAQATLASTQTNPWGIAVDDTNVYWVNDNIAGSVEMCPKTGCGASNTLKVTLAVNQNGARSMTIDATHVYWTTSGGNTVARCAKTGCGPNPAVLASALQSPHGIAVDATHVYFTERGTANAIKRVPKGGGTVEIFAANQQIPFNVVVDQKAVYWTNWVNPNGAIMKRAK